MKKLNNLEELADFLGEQQEKLNSLLTRKPVIAMNFLHDNGPGYYRVSETEVEYLMFYEGAIADDDDLKVMEWYTDTPECDEFINELN